MHYYYSPTLTYKQRPILWQHNPSTDELTCTYLCLGDVTPIRHDQLNPLLISNLGNKVTLINQKAYLKSLEDFKTQFTDFKVTTADYSPTLSRFFSDSRYTRRRSAELPTSISRDDDSPSILRSTQSSPTLSIKPPTLEMLLKNDPGNTTAYFDLLENNEKKYQALQKLGVHSSNKSGATSSLLSLLSVSKSRIIMPLRQIQISQLERMYNECFYHALLKYEQNPPALSSLTNFITTALTDAMSNHLYLKGATTFDLLSNKNSVNLAQRYAERAFYADCMLEKLRFFVEDTPVSKITESSDFQTVLIDFKQNLKPCHPQIQTIIACTKEVIITTSILEYELSTITLEDCIQSEAFSLGPLKTKIEALQKPEALLFYALKKMNLFIRYTIPLPPSMTQFQSIKRLFREFITDKLNSPTTAILKPLLKPEEINTALNELVAIVIPYFYKKTGGFPNNPASTIICSRIRENDEEIWLSHSWAEAIHTKLFEIVTLNKQPKPLKQWKALISVGVSEVIEEKLTPSVKPEEMIVFNSK